MRGTVSCPAVLSAPVVQSRQVGGLLGGDTPGRPPLSALQGLDPPEESGEGPPHTCEGLLHRPRHRQYCLLQLGSFGLKTGVKGGEGEVLTVEVTWRPEQSQSPPGPGWDLVSLGVEPVVPPTSCPGSLHSSPVTASHGSDLTC